MTKPKRWECTFCENEEKAPLAEECPECGVIGYRYPKNTSRRTYTHCDKSLGAMRRDRRERLK